MQRPVGSGKLGLVDVLHEYPFCYLSLFDLEKRRRDPCRLALGVNQERPQLGNKVVSLFAEKRRAIHLQLLAIDVVLYEIHNKVHHNIVLAPKQYRRLVSDPLGHDLEIDALRVDLLVQDGSKATLLGQLGHQLRLGLVRHCRTRKHLNQKAWSNFSQV